MEPDTDGRLSESSCALRVIPYLIDGSSDHNGAPFLAEHEVRFCNGPRMEGRVEHPQGFARLFF
jgi:hypothetical protein